MDKIDNTNAPARAGLGHLWWMPCLGAMLFGTAQAFATATPPQDTPNYCPDVVPCMSVCGHAGGIYYGLLPNGEVLCDCCAPE